MSRIVAFDLSLTATGYALAVDGKLESNGLIAGRETGIHRIIYVSDRVNDRADQLKPDLVVLEDLSFMSKGQAVHEHAGLATMVKAEMVRDKRQYVLVAPHSLKKFCCGSAGSTKNPVKKEHVLKFLATRFGHDVNDNNVADAIVLAYIGMALLGEWEPRIDAQREVLKKINETNPSLRNLIPVAQSAPMELWE